jgi:hypothetical protein
MPFLYHVKPAEMRGRVLYPLNRLRTRQPDLYERELAKYVGREALFEVRIPLLDVLWNDALHLSPIHPSKLAAAWRAAGLWSEIWEREFFEIPLDRIDGNPCVWFASGALHGASSDAPIQLSERDFTWFRPAAYRELVDAPPRHQEHLRQRSKQGRRPRPFAYVPHVLVAGPIDVTGVSIVRADVLHPLEQAEPRYGS